ncbi:GNAT family N-acetyltransferase [Gemmobacter denitrificans]|uniref:GNAT family N-acetyltransferase n=1 Tax=Gemmobacter denitrificans TaxID=3123040 RepID=A0ABU8BRS5_9RHOB
MALPARLKAGPLLLRPPIAEDGAAVVAALSQPRVSRWLSRVPHPYGLADFTAWLGRADQAGGRWSIVEAGVCIGAIGLEAELGYWLTPAAQGRGIASRAAQAVQAAHFADPAAGPVQAGYFEGNAPSARVLAKLGFVETGRDLRRSLSLGVDLPHVVLRLTRADWAAAHPLVIDTARLRLAPLDADRDGAELARIGGQPDVARNMASLLSPWPEQAVRDWIARGAWQGCLGFRLGIWRAGRLIGSVGIGGTPVSVGYFLDPDHWGHGYATEAMQGLLGAVLPRFAPESVTADHFADNPASGAVLRKLGFRPIGQGHAASGARDGLHPNIRYDLDRSAFLRQHGDEGETA